MLGYVRVLQIGLLIGFVVALAFTRGAQAAPPRTNIRATHAYLLARYRLERARESELRAGVRLAREYGERFERECAGVLAGAPKLTVEHPNPNTLRLGPEPALDFGIEALGTFSGLFAKPTTVAVIQFERRVEHLRWADRELTNLVHVGARQDAREVEEPTPDLCADAKFWAATGFREVSPATRRYVQEHEGENPEDEGGLAELQRGSIAQRLQRFEDFSDKALARRLKAMNKEALLKLQKATAAAASRVT